MFLRRVVTQAAEGIGVTTNMERPSGEASMVAGGMLLVEEEGDKSRACGESLEPTWETCEQ